MLLGGLVTAFDPLLIGMTCAGYWVLRKTEHRWWMVIIAVTVMFPAAKVWMFEESDFPLKMAVIGAVMNTSAAAAINASMSR
ncbi:MAG: hypothetical protein NXH72_05190 [Hyphomonadaceae bacterium]|nr:hypothetical protein [Hyphomonadaceae bacterium]